MGEHVVAPHDLADLTDDEDFVEIVEVLRNVRRRHPNYRPRVNHFLTWTDQEFIQRFRLSKQCTRFVVERIREQIMSPTDRNHAVTAEEMVLATLRYYASGNFLQSLGDFIGIDKGTVSRIVWNVSRAIAQMYGEFIKMPITEPEFRSSSQKFYNRGRFPRCIGAVDCTHIKIISPGGDNAEIYRNRKGFFSFNVQAICDADCKFQDVVCRWPGSSHDSHIFASSNIRARFENNEFEKYVLVGDSGYGIKKYMITPLGNPQTRAEQLFNESQIKTRNCIERLFGQWKRRFPVLAFGILLSVDKVEAVVIATAVLENIAKLLNEPLPPNNEEEEAAINFVDNVNNYMNVNNFNNINNIVRHQLINDYFPQF